MSRHCPDPETLAAFVDRTLSAPDKLRVERHLLECSDCYFIVEGASEWKDDEGSVAGRGARGTLFLRAAGWVGALVGASALLWWSGGLDSGIWTREHVDDAHEEIAEGVDLASAVGDQRLVAARLTGGFVFAPQPPVERGLKAGRESWTLYEAASRIRREAEEHPSAEALAELGKAHLLLGELDEAVAQLEAAAGRAPESARIQSDLAAAYHQRALDGKADDFLAAYEAAEAATRLDPELEEALFNRALALESLFLRRQAGEAWDRFLAAHPDPGWAEEGRERRERLAPVESRDWQAEILRLTRDGTDTELRDLVFRRAYAARVLLQTELLPAWGRAVMADRMDEAEELERDIARLGDVLSQRTDDPFFLAMTTEVGEVDSENRATLARVHIDLGRAGKAWNDRDLEEAQLAFERAASLALDVGSVTWTWAATWARVAASALSPQDDPGRFDDLMESARGAGYWILIAEIQSHRGLEFHRSGEPAAALRPLTEARKIFETTGEARLASFMRFLLAEVYRDMGNPMRSWAERLKGLEGGSSDISQRVGDLVLGAGYSALMEARPVAALAFLAERTELGFDGSTGDEVLTRVLLARTRLALDDSTGAKDEWERASLSLHRVTDERVRRRAESEVLLAGAQLSAAEGLDGNASRFLSEAEEAFAEMGNRARLPALALLQAEVVENPEEQLLEALSIAERTQPVEDPWLPGHDLHRELVEALVEVRLRQGDWQGAWIAAERGRIRHQPDVSLEDVQRFLGPGEEAHYYFVLPDQLLHWNVKPRDIGQSSTPISKVRLEELAEDLADELQEGRDSGNAIGGELYDALFGREGGPPPQRLVFFPDQALDRIPLAVLRHPGNGKYLVETTVVSGAVDAETFLRTRKTLDGRAAMGTGEALIVGAPELDRLEFPDLPPLRSAKSEAEEIAALYEKAVLLMGARADAESILELIGDAEVFHFAGHAVVEPGRPGFSHLALARKGERAGALYARDLKMVDLSAVRLVTLSACGTASGHALESGSPKSLARAFLDAGAGAVIASLWPVIDEHSSALHFEIHEALLRGEDPAAALRSAQVRFALSGGPEGDPIHWAGFQFMGG